MKGDIIIMNGLLSYDNYKNGGIELFKYSVKQGICISGEVVEDFVNNNYELIEDEGYEDFSDSGRWTIGKYYIIVVDGEYYQFWEEVGLTELQENHIYDQSFLKVREAEIKKLVWEGVE